MKRSIYAIAAAALCYQEETFPEGRVINVPHAVFPRSVLRRR